MMFFAALLSVAAPVSVHAETVPVTSSEAAKLVEAKAIIAIMYPPEKRDQKMHDMMQTIMNQLRASLYKSSSNQDSGLKPILDRFLDKVPDELMPTIRQYFPRQLDAWAHAYCDEFSLDELKQIHAFAETPAGAHYLYSATTILKNPAVQKANEEYFIAAQSVQKKMTQDLVQQIAEYVKSHPDSDKKP